MDRFILKAIGLAVLATIVCSRVVGAPPCGADCLSQGEVSAAIRQLVTTEADASRPDRRRLYESVEYRPLWIAGSRLSPQGKQVLLYLSGIQSRGLRPSDYGLDELELLDDRLDSGGAPAPLLARVDVTMSVALLRALSDLNHGRVNPATLGIDLPRAGTMDLQAVGVAVSRAERVAPVIESVEPAYPGYAALIQALSRYRALAADSSLRAPPAAGQSVRPGDAYPGVRDLARLLAALGDLPDSAVASLDDDRFDGAIVDAVTAFQRRHGLEPDGVLGRATMAELRIPPAERVRQIELALERWRWLPHNPPPRYIIVNVPEFRLTAFDREVDRSGALALNVIVGGSRGHRTPIFAATMREVVFHPYWDVPLPIARNELVPIIRRTPQYFTNGDFEIVQGLGEDARVYALNAQNLARVAAGTLRIRQRPGAGNALGGVKLVFPNPYNVFLHDTPGRGLFARARRDLSHGCIRVEQPALLTEFVLTYERGWDARAIQAALGNERTQHVGVTRPVTVFVQYFTASVDEAGKVQFRRDIYGRDPALAAALAPPTN